MKNPGNGNKEDIISRFGEYVSSGKAEFFKSVGIDFVFGRREGPYIWDATSGKRLINCHCNGGVFNLGHRNPEIINALKGSLDELDIGNHHLISEQRAILAERLAELMPGDITYTVFGVGGGDYHGHTGFALATGDEQYKAPFGPGPEGFIQVPFNDKKALKREVDNETAAVIFETVPATFGVPVPDADFFTFTHDICKKNGALFIADEVQTGLGRTGKLWGIEHFNVTPDIMVIGKGLSGGIYPMSATCFRAKYESFFHDHPFIHISTFGGAEVGCPVVLAVLEESSRPEFLENVNKLAGIFSSGFKYLKKKHPEILVGLRQLGLMMGIEMVNESCGPIMSKTCYDNGILSIYSNNDTKISQLLPPLIIDEDTAREIIERVDSALDDAKKFLNL
ncbi:MAG: aspartate aminotransferase family protein [Syntrophobacterales bacterium]|nr:aspartate aminotransferase family protein [Syntrophobacterales bacterium]